jgi:hypothetical protein
LYGAIIAAQRFSASERRVRKSFSRPSKYARSFGRSCDSLPAISFAMTLPFSGSSQ